MGWHSDQINPTDRFRVHVHAKRTSSDINWNQSGSWLFATTDDPTSHASSVTKEMRFFQNSPSSNSGKLQFFIDNGSVFCGNVANAKDIDILLFYNCDQGKVYVHLTLDGVPQTELSFTVGTSGQTPITDFSYALPVGFDLYDFSVKPQGFFRLRSVTAENVGSVFTADPLSGTEFRDREPDIVEDTDVYLRNTATSLNDIFYWTSDHKLHHANSQGCLSDLSDAPEGESVQLKIDQKRTATFGMVKNGTGADKKPIWMYEYLDGEGRPTGRFIHKVSGSTSLTWSDSEADKTNGSNNFTMDYITSVPVTFTAENNRVTTLCLPFPVKLPEGVQASYIIAAGSDNSDFGFKQITSGYIPAFEGVILLGDEAKTYDFPITFDEVPALEDNIMKGVLARTTQFAPGHILTVQKVDGLMGLMVTTEAVNMPHNSAYLPIPANYLEPGKLLPPPYHTVKQNIASIPTRKTSHQYARSLSYDEVKIYGDIEDNSDDLNSLYHIVNTQPTAIKAPRGTSVTIKWYVPTNMSTATMLSAFCDIDHDGDFESDGDFKQLLRGSYKGSNFGTTNGEFTVAIPEDAPLGFCRIRLRFDPSTNSVYDADKGYVPAAAVTDGHIYDIILNVIDHTARLNVIYDEKMGSLKAVVTPMDKSKEVKEYTEFPAYVEPYSSVKITALPKEGYEFVQWENTSHNPVTSANPLEFDIQDAPVRYYADFKGRQYHGTIALKGVGCNHDWKMEFTAVEGKNAAIEGLTQEEGAPFCGTFDPETYTYTGGCAVEIPAYVTIEETGHQVPLTEVGETIVYSVPTIKKLILPATLETLSRIHISDVTDNVTEVVAADIPSGITGTHAGSGYAWKWQVDPIMTKSEEWWFVGEFQFPDALTGEFNDWGCSLLTSRKFPSRNNDAADMNGRFQVWIDGAKRTSGQIRIVHDGASSGSPKEGDYFHDKTTGNRINVLGKIVKYEVHNYPHAHDSGSTIMYSVKTYDIDTYSAESEPLEEGFLEFDYANFLDLAWLSNYIPDTVKWKVLKFYQPYGNVYTYQDDASETTEWWPIKDGILDLVVPLERDHSWTLATHFRPQTTGREKIILASEGNYTINTPVTEGFRISQHQDGTYTVRTSTGEHRFQTISTEQDEPCTFMVFRDVKTGLFIVTLADHLDMIMEDWYDYDSYFSPDSDIRQLKTEATYKDNKLSVLVTRAQNLMFSNCQNLEEVVIRNKNFYQSIDGAVYDYYGRTLVRWPEGKMTKASDTEGEGTVRPTVYDPDNELDIFLPETVETIGLGAFSNCYKTHWNVWMPDNITTVERMSRVGSFVYYNITPENFHKITKNDQVSFRICLTQERADSEWLDDIEDHSFVQVSLTDRFAGHEDYNILTLPFGVEKGLWGEYFSDVKLLNAATYTQGANGRHTVNARYANLSPEADDMLAGVPYLVKVQPSQISAHGAYLRFKHRNFDTALHDIGPLTATPEAGSAESPYNLTVSMLGNIDPAIVDAPANVKRAEGVNREYVYNMIVEDNQMKKVETVANKGYNGAMQLSAVDPDGSHGEPTVDVTIPGTPITTALTTIGMDTNCATDPAYYTVLGVSMGDSFDTLPAGIYIHQGTKVIKR